ncbi:MAG: hypothetical protein K6L73_02870 [Cellvibrionaceae bacterium]
MSRFFREKPLLSVSEHKFMQNDLSTRLNKYISDSGICSRREADRFIEQGNVFKKIRWTGTA